MSRWRCTDTWAISALLIGVAVLAAAQSDNDKNLLSPLLSHDVIRWDPIREVWVDMKTKGVVDVVANSKTNPRQGTVAAAPTYTQQGETKPQKPSDHSLFPMVLPDKGWFESCGRNLSDVLTLKSTGCDIFKDVINCQQLAQMGYLPPGVQSYSPGGHLTGGFSLPNGCSSGNLGVEYNGHKMVFNSPQIPILAVIAKELPLSKVYYYGSGVAQGRLLNIHMYKAEFCYAPPTISPLYVSKTAQFSTGMQPGTAAWNFFKTVALAPPFTNNIASMFRGDSADATWVLSVTKTGTDTSYQGAVSGQITITNPQAEPVTVYNINDYVQGGPQSTVTCGTPIPFTIQPCSSTVCSYIAYWPVSPAAGAYTNLADVQYSVGTSGVVGNQVGTAAFQVANVQEAVGLMNTAAGAIPSGQAVVQDGMAPQQYYFSGTSQQSYVTSLTCPDTAIINNEAVLTASTGQQIRQSSTVQKLCFELQVRVAQTAAPFVGAWRWSVSKQASTSVLTLKPSETAWDRYVRQQVDLAAASGQDPAAAMQMITGGQNASLVSAAMPGTTNAEVTYTVTFTRQAPGAVVAGTPAFQTTGTIFITNSSPLNAALQSVQVTISNNFGGMPYTTPATCDLLTVAAGQTLQCRYVANPSFNPIGAQISATAVYLNNKNGVPSGATTSFASAPVVVAGGTGSNRKLLAAMAGPQEAFEDIRDTVGKFIQSVGAGSRDEVIVMPPKILKPEELKANNITLPEFPANPLAGLRDLSKHLPNVTLPANHPLAQLGKALSQLTGGGQTDDSGDTSSGDDSGNDYGDDSAPAVVQPGDSAPAAGQTPPAAAAAAPTAAAAAATAPAPAATPPPMPLAPTVAAAPNLQDLQGLQDECVDVSDLFARGNNYVTGVVTSGEIAQGRICKTTTFTYTVRYGPFNECFEKEAANQASFVTSDTKTMGNSTQSVTVRVQGCGAAVAAKAKTYAIWAKKSYTWSVAKSMIPPLLTMGPGSTAKAAYTINYTRSEILVNSKLSVTLQFDNLAASDAAPVNNFTYSVQLQCGTGTKSRTGTFKCPAGVIPAGGAPMTCPIQLDLPCVGPGTLVASALSNDKTLTSQPFNFPAPKSVDTLEESECAVVVDEFSSGTGLVSGNVSSGVRPYGKLCGSKQFEYTVTFGPFATCGRRKAMNTASLTTGPPTNSASAQSTLNIDVTGCEVYTPLQPVVAAYANPSKQPNPSQEPNPSRESNPTRALGKDSNPNTLESLDPKVIVLPDDKSSVEVTAEIIPSNMRKAGPRTYTAPGSGTSLTKCVSSVLFWKNCMSSGKLAGRCAVVLKLPTGPHTAFFPIPYSKVLRTYKTVLTKPTNSGAKQTDFWFKAAQAVAATQLNELAGVSLPSNIKDALTLVGAAISNAITVPPTLGSELQGLPGAVALLERFCAGQAGVPNC